MKNQINYKSINKNNIGFLKSKKLNNNKYDTIILDSFDYWNDLEYKYSGLKNIKNLIIDNRIVKSNIYDNFSIRNTKAENIYFYDQKNLGGLTIDINKLVSELDLYWNNNSICNLKEINLIFNNKTEKIKLKYKIESISITLDTRKGRRKSLYLKIIDDKNIILYTIDSENGILNKSYIVYTYSSDDLKDGVLDLRDINNKEKVYSDNINVDTLIVSKDTLFSKNFKYTFDEKLNIKKIKIIDDNDMKLNPENLIIFNDVIDIYHPFITNKKLTKFIYLDNNNRLNFIDKEKVLSDDNVDDFKFINNSDCTLIMIKYKNKTFKIIDEFNEYIIDDLFKDFMFLNINSYDFYDTEIPFLKKYILYKEWDKVFEEKIIDDNLLVGIYKDYLNFIDRIKKLKEIGFNDKAIKYFISKKYDNFINPNSNNIIDIKSICDSEINMFNNISDDILYGNILKKSRSKKL